MKKIISCLLVLCVIFGFCACGKKETDADANEKLNIKVVENEKAQKIAETLGTMKIDEVLGDIKNIDLYLEPDYSEKDYIVKTGNDNETNYYSGGELVYSVHESDYEQEFANYTKTASGLDAKVTYFIDSGDNRSVCVETDKYRIFANNLDTEDVCGLGGTEIAIYSVSAEALFENSVNYYHENGTATFTNAVYLENGNYQRYSFGIDMENVESEYTDVLVKCETPETSDEIINAVQSDKSYDSVKILIDNSDEWYYDGDKWYVKATLGIFTDSREDAEKYIEKNGLKGEIITDGMIAAEIENVVLPVSEAAIIEDGKLPYFITEEHDDYEFRAVTFDDNGMIKEISSDGTSRD